MPDPSNFKTGHLLKMEAPAVKPQEPKKIDTCVCLDACPFSLPVYASDIKDISSVVMRKSIKEDKYSFELKKPDGNVVECDKDIKTLPITCEEKDTYAIAFIDWSLVKIGNNFGVYTLRISRGVFGSTPVVVREVKYYLSPDDGFSRGKTVKLATKFDGWKEYFGSNFTEDLDIRLPGDFVRVESKLERDIFQTQDFEQVQNRDVVTDTYTLTVRDVPVPLYEELVLLHLTASEIAVTKEPYGFDNPPTYENFPVFLESFGDLTHLPNKHCNFAVNFTGKVINNVNLNNHGNSDN